MKTWTAIFERSQVDKWPGLSYSLLLCSLSSWVLLFGADMGKKKNTTHTHTQTHSLCFRTLWLTSCFEVGVSPANLLAYNFECILRSSGCMRGTALYRRGKHQRQDRWSDGAFFPLFPCSFVLSGEELDMLSQRGNWRIVSCLKI